MIGQEHYELWKANFGNTSGGASGMPPAIEIPEPPSWLLTAIVLSTLTRQPGNQPGGQVICRPPIKWK